MSNISKTGNRAVVYACFPLGMQRDKRADAELKAIERYAASHGYVLTQNYIDCAASTVTDKRPEFQWMMADAGAGAFDAVIVYRLSHLSNDSYDSAIYKHKLNKQGVELLSVTENLDGSPDSAFIESVIEAIEEYSSANLNKEAGKGGRSPESFL